MLPGASLRLPFPLLYHANKTTKLSALVLENTVTKPLIAELLITVKAAVLKVMLRRVIRVSEQEAGE